MPLLRYKGSTALPSVEVRDGKKVTLNPWDVINVAEENDLIENETLFEALDYWAPLIQKKTVITSAQILALNTTPISLVPAPWAWYFIDVVSIVAGLDYGAAAYATNVTLVFSYTNGAGTKVSADIAALLDATADKVVRVGGIEAALVPTANAAVVVSASGGNPVTGDSPIAVTVLYRILPIY